MAEAEEEGMDFASQFTNQFGFGGNAAATEQRLKAERKAGLTAKQRAARKAAKGPPTKQKNFRATAETRAQLEALGKHLDKDHTAVIAMAIDMLAKAELGGRK